MKVFYGCLRVARLLVFHLPNADVCQTFFSEHAKCKRRCFLQNGELIIRRDT